MEGNEAKSVVFTWRPEDFNNLLRSCDVDDEVQITLNHLSNKDAKILEAGCGLGRVVKYLYDRGYCKVVGIEYDKASVQFLNENFPELHVVQGDILQLPYAKESFDVVLSYGVIEHFPDGPHAPLKAMFDVLRPQGLAIITIPSFNVIRRFLYVVNFCDVRKYAVIRKIFNKKPLERNKKRYSYYIEPQYGRFFEYRFTPRQFESMCKQAGFEIVESRPIAMLDGLFHIFGKKLVTFGNWEFKMNFVGRLVNALLSKIPFFHNHMHMCVVRKP